MDSATDMLVASNAVPFRRHSDRQHARRREALRADLVALGTTKWAKPPRHSWRRAAARVLAQTLFFAAWLWWLGYFH